MYSKENPNKEEMKALDSCRKCGAGTSLPENDFIFTRANTIMGSYGQ